MSSACYLGAGAKSFHSCRCQLVPFRKRSIRFAMSLAVFGLLLMTALWPPIELEEQVDHRWQCDPVCRWASGRNVLGPAEGRNGAGVIGLTVLSKPWRLVNRSPFGPFVSSFRERVQGELRRGLWTPECRVRNGERFRTIQRSARSLACFYSFWLFRGF